MRTAAVALLVLGKLRVEVRGGDYSSAYCSSEAELERVAPGVAADALRFFH